MAVYTPRQVPQRSQKKSGWRRLVGIAGILLRRKKKTVQHRAQSVVQGSQRTWKLERFSKSTVLLMSICGILLVSSWLGYQLLTRSNIFRLTDIRVFGHRMTTERQILEISGLQRGISLLRFNAQDIVTKIKKHPWIDRVEVKTQWPSGLQITVHEYVPLALVNIDGDKEKKLRYLNNQGHVFAEIEQGQDIDYPVITGLQAHKDIDADNIVKGSLAEAAVTILALAAKGNAVLPIQAISEIHLDPKQGLILYLVDRPFPIYYGRDRLQTKYYRLIKVIEQLYSRKQVDAVKEIRMDYLDDKVLVIGAKIDG